MCHPGVWLADVITSLSGVTFVFVLLCLLRFSSLCFRSSRGPSFNRPSICRCPDSHTCFFLFFFRCRFFRVLFCTISAFSLYEEYVVRPFLPNDVFYLVTTSWIFYISLCENSINHQSMTATHVRLPTEIRYFGNSSLPSGSPSFLVPRSTPGLPGMFEVAEMLYCDYRLNHLEDSVVPVTLERATSVHL